MSSSHAKSDSQRLWQGYQSLPSDEQRILRLLSIIYSPQTQTELQALIKGLGWQDAQGLGLAPLAGKDLRERLLAAGLITFSQSQWRCHPAIVDALTAEAAGRADFQSILATVLAKLPLELPRHAYEYIHPDARLRILRTALFQGNTKLLTLMLRADDGCQPLAGREAEALLKLHDPAFDGPWFDRLTYSLQYQILDYLLTLSMLWMRDRRQLFRVLERICGQGTAVPPALFRLLAQQRLARGMPMQAEEPPDPTAPDALQLLGWQYFQQGDRQAAIASFEAALLAWRKATRKRNIYVPNLPGLIYILALLERGDPGDLQQIRVQAAMAEKLQNQIYDPFLSIFLLLAEVSQILEGRLDMRAAQRLEHSPYAEAPYFDLLLALVLGWLNERPTPQQLDGLVKHLQRARDGGWYWYASECAAVLARWDRAVADLPADCVAPRLLQLIHPVAAWERALEALKTINAPAGGITAPPAESEQRLIWLLHLQDQTLELQPREQKRLKNGTWSGGRAVALKRLYEGAEQLDFLTSEDRAIARHISHQPAYWGYSGREYQLNAHQAALAAIGHPRLFWADQPESPVELARGEPRLLVTRKKQQLQLLLQPYPPLNSNESTRYICYQEDEHKIRLVQFSVAHLHIAGILGQAGLEVPLSAEQRVLESIAAVAPLLTVHSDIGGAAGGAEQVTADSQPHLHLQPLGEGLKINWFVRPLGDAGPLLRPGQGGASLFAEIDGRQLQTSRDLKQERQRADELLKKLQQACPWLADEDQWQWQIDTPQDALELLLQLQELGEAAQLHWPQGKSLRLLREQGTAQMQLNVRQQGDWFAVEGELALEDGEVLNLQRLLALLRESPGRFVRLDGDRILTLSQDLRRRLDALQTYGDKGRFHPLASAALDELSDGMQVKAGKPWKEQLARLREAQELTPRLPSTLQAELRDYQLEGFHWMARLAHWGAGACLADDMGLGKTLQALALVLSRAAQGPTLVLAPTSVCMNWLDETGRFAPTLNARLFGSSDRATMLDSAGPFDLIVCSYGLLQTESERLQAVPWHTLVADEAQAIKNPLAKRSKAASALPANFRLALTGTPIENHLGELWSLFHFINPGLLGSQERFRQRFADPIENSQDREARARLRKLIGPFMLRRLKSKVLTELPARTEITLRVPLSEQEAAFYEALRRDALARTTETQAEPGEQRFRVLAEIMRLRRACCHPSLVLAESGIPSAKLQAFDEVLGELRENHHKALVFSQFVDYLGLLRTHLDGQGVRYQYLDGSTPVKQRKAAVDAFQAGDGELFLISLKAGGTGLNLTAADYVIHMDPWWNPAVEDQASDRAHRLGQQRPVTIYRLVAANTIEDKIVSLHARKRDLADSLLEGGELGGKLSVADLVALMGES